LAYAMARYCNWQKNSGAETAFKGI
jgi:hypothetical protein